MAAELPLGQEHSEPVHAGPEDEGELHGIAGTKQACGLALCDDRHRRLMGIAACAKQVWRALSHRRVGCVHHAKRRRLFDREKDIRLRNRSEARKGGGAGGCDVPRHDRIEGSEPLDGHGCEERFLVLEVPVRRAWADAQLATDRSQGQVRGALMCKRAQSRCHEGLPQVPVMIVSGMLLPDCLTWSHVKSIH